MGVGDYAFEERGKKQSCSLPGGLSSALTIYINTVGFIILNWWLLVVSYHSFI